MRVKEIKRTANVAWSPANQHPVYLAAGTAAQQLDATFSTSAALELYNVDLSDPSLDMKCVASLPSECRFHKLVWGGGIGSADNGLIVGGADGGQMFVWDAQKMLDGAEPEDVLLTKLDKHNGVVAALDFNPYKPGLLASGGSDSDIWIWDLNHSGEPMTPGSKSKPLDDVTCVAWNKQVHNILASTYAGRCVIWDLKKNEPIIKVSDSMSRIQCKQAAWHPDVATQICLASEDDHSPVIQVWDLRYATSPVKILENHQRGILSMSWCSQDSDLLLSCGKDNRILCWNPNSVAQSGEVVYELPTSNQWSFDIQWCPRNPSMISNCSFDGQISIYSLLGGGVPPNTPTQKVSDSFPADPFAQPHQKAPTGEVAPEMLKKPPRWLRRPVGASFGFGGKLVTFSDPDLSLTPAQQHQQAAQGQQTLRHITISQVVTEPQLLNRSQQLEQALASGDYVQYCEQKVEGATTDADKQLWQFLKVHFERDPRNKYLHLLGYDQTELAKKVSANTGSQCSSTDHSGEVDAGELAKKMAQLDTSLGVFNMAKYNIGETPLELQPSDSDEASGGESSAFDQIAEVNGSRSESPLPISTGEDFSGLLSEALLLANFEAAVEVCIHHDRMAEAIILAIAGGPELLTRTQNRFFAAQKNDVNKLISSVVTRDFERVVKTCELSNWKEALAITLTYAKPEQFSNLCDMLGKRLEEEGDYMNEALLCHVCSGNVDQLIRCLTNMYKDSPNTLQDMIEKVMLLRKANELANSSGASSDLSTGPLSDKLGQYAQLLASQGSLLTALNYLGSSNEESLLILRHRLTSALGPDIPGVPQIAAPFQQIDVKPEGAAVQQPQQAAASAAAASRYLPQQQHQHHHSGGQAVTSSFQPVSTVASNYQQTYTAQSAATQPGNRPGTMPVSSAAQPYPQPGYQQMPQTGYMAQQTPTSAQQPMPAQRGSLAHKYPASSTYQQQLQQTTGTPSSSMPYASYQQQPQDPLSSSHGSGSLSSMMGAGGASGAPGSQPTQQPQVFNPAMQHTPGAPMMNPSAAQPTASAAPAVPSYQDTRPATAWNDPPVVPAASSKKNKTPAGYVAPTPITTPLLGAAQPDQGPPGGPSYNNPPTNMYNGQQQQYQQQQQQQQSYQQQNIYNPAAAATQQQQQTPAAPRNATPPPPVEKPPIPEEHQVLHDILTKLAQQCLAATNNQQTKRKIDDVTRKLEFLYDKLREQSLSSNITLSLHQIIQSIQQCDYQAGLAYHSQLISQGNFSEISSFMPSLKILMQSANSLQVYVQ